MKEQLLHRIIAQYLEINLGSGTWFTTFPAGGGGRIRGAILRGMGLKAGVPDIVIIHAGRAYWPEIKPEGGRLSTVQIICHAALRLAGCEVEVVRSIEEMEQALVRWKIPLRGRIAA